ncbi:TPA: hypothetical protein PFD34_003333 [Vibrio cholerae]|nr:hypothetical protein [Vibrio cholerae]HDG1511701.1 hypothetical protein [Vibrio cholerae]
MFYSIKSKFSHLCIGASAFYSSISQAAGNPFDDMGQTASEAQESLMANVVPLFVFALLLMLVLRYFHVIGNKVLITALVCLVLFGLVPVGVEWYIGRIS